MSSTSKSAINPSTILSFDERQWIVQIRRTLDEELVEDEIIIPVTIFSVPKTLMENDPNSYIPHQVPLGPYHYWRPQMCEMERYKLAAAKRMQHHLKNLKFEDAVLQLTKYESQIRGCYHRCLSYDCETLAWLMAVDACFLLEFLEIFAVKDGKLIHEIPPRLSHLVDINERRAIHNGILKDIVMLENQIPLFVLRKMLEIKFSCLEIADNEFSQMLMGFFQVLSPFKIMEDLTMVQAMECAHLLDFLYRSIVPKIDQRLGSQMSGFGVSIEGDEGTRSTPRSTSHIGKLFNEVWKILKKINKGPIRIVLLLTKLPWKIISNIPGIKFLKWPVESLMGSFKDKKEDSESEDSTTDDKPPLPEEIAIPSVTDLSKAYVKFSPTNGGILSMRFDENTCTFYLPTISLDEKSEILLKNLVAYEACNTSRQMIFTRYTELMSGIIDTEEDAKILRENGIIVNRLKSDAEAAKLWNGMNRPIKITKAPHLDKVIGEVNKFYNGRWKVKYKKLMKAYVYGSWKILTLLACVMLLLLMTLQAFCSVYNCERVFHIQVSDD